MNDYITLQKIRPGSIVTLSEVFAETKEQNFVPPVKELRCWTCTLLLNKDPLHFAIRFDSEAKEGLFCSFPCLASYESKKVRHGTLFSSKRLFQKMHDREPNMTNLAPNRKLMSCYGGELSEEQYKQRIDELEAEW